MANDPLAFSSAWLGPGSEADFDAIYTALSASQRGRKFLAEYLNRHRNVETQTVMRAIGRVEEAMRSQSPIFEATALCRELIELAATITRLEAEFVAAGAAPNALAAAERVQDIAFVLRERNIDDALCDVLDAAMRELLDACARNDAAAKHAYEAAASLGDLVARIEDIIGRAMPDRGGTNGETKAVQTAESVAGADAPAEEDLLPPPGFYHDDAAVDGADEAAVLAPEAANGGTPASQARDDLWLAQLPANEIFPPQPPAPLPDEAQKQEDDLLPALHLNEGRPRPAAPAAVPTRESLPRAASARTPAHPPLSRLARAAVAPPAAPKTAPAPTLPRRPMPIAAPQPAPPLSPRSVAARAVRASPRPPPPPRPSDLLRALRALSDEELIALFS